MHLFSDRGTPKSIRTLNSYSGHTYKFTKEVRSPCPCERSKQPYLEPQPVLIGRFCFQDGTFVYVKIHFKSTLGVQSHLNDEAVRLAGEAPDYHTLDLFNAIERGDYPSWNMFIQVMKPKEAESYRWNIFDMTKVWPHADFPLIPVGKLTLNKNVRSYSSSLHVPSPPQPS
jgi:catalase